jgi:uncharacterized protein (DUF302 family)
MDTLGSFRRPDASRLTHKEAIPMTYHFTGVSKLPFDETVAKVTDELKEEGFGILTEIEAL